MVGRQTINLKKQDPSDPIYDRRLSVQLIDRSVAHVFVLAMPEEDEPANLIQSVSMELERLTTLMDHGLKDHQDVMLLIQDGLMECIAGSAGNVCKGLIAGKEYDWDIEYYTQIDTTFKPTVTFCYRCIEKRWDLCEPSRNNPSGLMIVNPCAGGPGDIP